MRFEKQTFVNRSGNRLAARLDLPEAGPPRAYALFAHCFTCTKDLKAAAHISRALTGEGLGVLRFDFTGLGESEGDFSHTTFSSNVDDLVAAAEFLAAQTGGPGPRILVGHSLGGAAVLRAAARIPDSRAVVTIGAPADPEHVTRHPKSFVALDRADHLLSDPEDSRYAGRLIAAWAEKYVETAGNGKR